MVANAFHFALTKLHGNTFLVCPSLFRDCKLQEKGPAGSTVITPRKEVGGVGNLPIEIGENSFMWSPHPETQTDYPEKHLL